MLLLKYINSIGTINMSKVKKIVIYIVVIALLIGCSLGFILTPQLSELPNNNVQEIKPFSSSSELGCNYYRIPSLITTKDGVVISSVDARFGGTKDSPNNIDTAVSLSNDNGKSWSQPELVLSFEDWENDSKILKENGKLSTKNSASAIDPAMLQDEETGRIFMIVDVFPYGTGAANSEKGSGFTEIDSNKYLMLKRDGEKEYNYYADKSGNIYSRDGNKTDYSLNSKFELYENGTPLTVNQKKLVYWYNVPTGFSTKKEVRMNIMYKDSLFHPMQTSYIYLIYSDDNGNTWSDPVNLNAQIKSDNDSFMGVCPGTGIQIKNGDYTGRLIFTAYYRDTETAQQRFTTIFSDDHGNTWNIGKGVSLSEDLDNLSETQLIQFPDGSLQSFSRSTVGNVASSISTDGGVTWSEPFTVDELPLSGGAGCQLSVLNYSGKIDGKDAVMLSAPSLDNRKNGCIYVGLITEINNGITAYKIDWRYKKEITDSNTDFGYSCLTQLPDGNIGILYESSNAPQSVDSVVFDTYTIEELCQNS